MYLSVLVTDTSVPLSVVWGISVSGMSITGIFNISISFLTLELKFVPAYLEISLGVFRYC